MTMLAYQYRNFQYKEKTIVTLRWRHNGHDSLSNHQPHDCLLNHLFRRRSKKTSKLRVTGLCAGNSPMTGEFPAQRASNADDVSIWRRLNSHMPTKWCKQLEEAQERCPFSFRGHPSNVKFAWDKKRQFWSELSVSGLYLDFEFTDGYTMMQKGWSNIEDVCALSFFEVIHQISRSNGP